VHAGRAVGVSAVGMRARWGVRARGVHLAGGPGISHLCGGTACEPVQGALDLSGYHEVTPRRVAACNLLDCPPPPRAASVCACARM